MAMSSPIAIMRPGSSRDGLDGGAGSDSSVMSSDGLVPLVLEGGKSLSGTHAPLTSMKPGVQPPARAAQLGIFPGTRHHALWM